MIDHEQIVSFMLRLKYSLNIQKPESLTCENIKLPAPKDKTIKFGFAPVCVTKGITTPEQFEEDCQCRREQGKVSGDFAASAQRFSGGEGSFGSESSLDFAAIQEYISSGRGVM